MYYKKLKKSIHLPERIDIFLIVAILIFIITPLIFSISIKTEEAPHQMYLYLSIKSEELFGKEITQMLLQEFEEKNPGIKILLTDGTQEPDIFVFDEGDFSALVTADALVELNFFTNYDSGTQQMAIPLFSYMDLLFYNIDILIAAGYDSPPKTRDQFLLYTRGVLRGNFGVLPAAISLSRDDRRSLSRDIFSWMWASGSSFWLEGDKPSLNTRALTNDLNFFAALFREGLLAPGVFEKTGEQRVEEFARSRISMMVASSSIIPYLKEKMREGSFGITTIPDSGTGGQYSIGLSAIYTGINSKSEYPEDAWNFLVFLTEKSSFLCHELKAVPGVVSDIIPGNYVIDDPLYSKAWEIFESSHITDDFSGKYNADAYKLVFLEELQNFFENSNTVQQTIASIQRRWDDVQGYGN